MTNIFLLFIQLAVLKSTLRKPSTGNKHIGNCLYLLSFPDSKQFMSQNTTEKKYQKELKIYLSSLRPGIFLTST